MEELQLIIQNIPTLLQYYIPGVCVIAVFLYFTSKNIAENIKVITSCVVSYVLLALLSLCRAKWQFLSKLPDSALVNSGLAIIIGVVIAAIMAMIYCSKWFSEIMVFFMHKTPNDNIWRDVLDFRKGSNLKIYLKEQDYYIIGHFRNIEEKGEESWLAISAFEKRYNKSNDIVKGENSYLNDDKVFMAIRLTDVDHIEIF